MDGVCTVAGCVGRELAPHVKKHGGKLIPESMKKDKDGRSNIDGAMVVAASGVQGRVYPCSVFFKRMLLTINVLKCINMLCMLGINSRICNHVDWPGSGSKEHYYERSIRDSHHCKTQVCLPLLI